MMAANPVAAPHTAVTARPSTGSSTRIAISAPPTAPKNEAAHARKGVSSHPKMRNTRRSHRTGQARFAPSPEIAVARATPGRNATPNVPSPQLAPGKWPSVATTASATLHTTTRPNAPTGETPAPLVDWFARIQAPIHERKVPTIHQTGWYHQLAPPPKSHQRWPYVPMFCSRVTSTRRNTPAAPGPIPAEPAMPSMLRGRVHRPGSRMTPARPTSTIAPINTVWSTPFMSSRDTSETSSTMTDSSNPSLTEPRTIEGMSVRSWSACSCIADCMPSPGLVGGGGEVYAAVDGRAKGRSGTPADDHDEVGDSPCT